MLKIAVVPILCIVVAWTWQFLNWVWFKPIKTERLLRKQGMKGNSYKFLFGDTKEANLMYDKSYSKPIAINDDILPRIMPDILHTVQKYGNYSFTWLGPRPRVFVLDHDVIRQVLSKHDNYHKSFKIVNPIAKMLVTGIVSMEGEEWSQCRSKLSSAFHLEKLKPMVPVIQSCCDNVINTWKETFAKDGKLFHEIDVFPYLEIFTSSVLAQLMFSSTYTEDIKRTFLKLSELEALGKLATDIFTLPGQKYFPTKKNRKAKEIEKSVRASFTCMINERLEKRSSETVVLDKDLLDMFMEELYQGKFRGERDRQRIIDGVIGQCKIFFFAGFGTSSNLLAWTMIMLSVHQDWQTRAREEVRQVLGRDFNDQQITSHHLSNLKIVTMILNEILRLYPAGMEFSRVVAEETKLGEYIVPKGTMVTCPILLLNRSPEIWGEDAGEFNPQRFAEGVSKANKGLRTSSTPYMPFGWGPRICIAQNFSYYETKTFLAILLKNFSFELSPTYTHAPFVDFTIHPQYGAPLVLRKL